MLTVGFNSSTWELSKRSYTAKCTAGFFFRQRIKAQWLLLLSEVEGISDVDLHSSYTLWRSGIAHTVKR